MSVSTPFREVYVGLCIENLRRQSFNHCRFELIVVGVAVVNRCVFCYNYNYFIVLYSL